MMLSACASIRWYGQAVGGQLDLLARREHIADLLADPSTDPELAERLRQVLMIREFAVAELGLPASRSYRHYADLERPAAVWNVIAAGPYSVDPVTWCYPIAGCVAYRGYFDVRQAETEAQRLAADGLDTLVAPAVAYSTLGWFDDPVLNTMLAWDDAGLAGLIFHELAHEALYVKGDTAFNEAFATTVERIGVSRWLLAIEDDAALEAWHARLRDRDRLTDLMLEARETLRRGYAERQGDEQALAEFKTQRFAALRADLIEVTGQQANAGPRAGSRRPLNNATLALTASYRQGVDAFTDLLDACGGSMACFHERVRRLAESTPEQRADFLRLNSNP
jgi:predicted aminopeptidase